MPKLVSIITAARNCAAKIDKTVQSVLSQDTALCDYLLVDGASTDDTVARAASYSGRVSVISEPDQGIYDALNKGIRRTSGHYLYFLGAGDALRQNAIAGVAPLLDDAPLSFLYGNVWCAPQKLVYYGRFSKSDLVIRNLCHQAVFYHRSLFERFGLFDLRYRIAADWVFNIRCFGDPKVKVRYTDSVIADFEGGGVSSGVEDAQFLADLPALVRDELGVRARLRYAQYRLRRRIHDWRVRAFH
jgi:glycosyltransferase involved in cell wall biosynthesis